MYSRNEAMELLRVAAENKDYSALETIILECKKDTSFAGLFNNSVPRKFLIWLKQGKDCAYCYNPVEYLESSFNFIIPLSKGGKNLANNKVVCCKECNDKKQYVTLDEKVDRQWILYNLKHKQQKLFDVIELNSK